MSEPAKSSFIPCDNRKRYESVHVSKIRFQNGSKIFWKTENGSFCFPKELKFAESEKKSLSIDSGKIIKR